MYSNKLVACVKAGGKVLREKGDEVYLPFGSEYTLYFKNENSRKVQINVEIDGQDVLFGDTLLLDAGKSMDLKGFVRDMMGNDNRAFKFITKTAAISDFRGDRAEDGLIKITYQFEKEKPEPRLLRKTDFYWDDSYQRVYTNCGGNKHPFEDSLRNVDLTWGTGGFVDNTTGINDTLFASNAVSNSVTTASMNASYSTDNNINVRAMNVSLNSVTASTVSNDPGITVEGSATGQSFQQGYIGTLENNKYTMVFQLRGLTSEEQIEEPITVKSKKQCPSCGKKFKSSFEYCPHDGTYLRA